MGGESRRDITAVPPEELTPHEFAKELARLLGSKDPAGWERLDKLRQLIDQRLRDEAKEAGLTLPEPGKNPSQAPNEDDRIAKKYGDQYGGRPWFNRD